MLEPHGGRLINRFVSKEEEGERKKEALALPSYRLFQEDLSLFYRIADGTLSPLKGPMTREQFDRVLEDEVILGEGKAYAWTIPIVFPCTDEEAKQLSRQPQAGVYSGDKLVGILTIQDIYPWDKKRYLEGVYNTSRVDHPGARMVLQDARKTLIGGEILAFPSAYSPPFPKEMMTPSQLRQWLKDKPWDRVVAFQTRNPLHRAHEYTIIYALEKLLREGANPGVCLNPLVGATKKDDVPAHVRMDCYRILLQKKILGEGDWDVSLWEALKEVPADRTFLVALDMKMFYGGPKEAIMHAIYRQNMGFTDIIIGRKHADAPFDDGTPIWGDFDAQEKFNNLRGELKIKNLNVGFACYFQEPQQVTLLEEGQKKGWHPYTISGSKVRQLLKQGIFPDERIMRKPVAKTLIDYYAQTSQSG